MRRPPWLSLLSWACAACASAPLAPPPPDPLAPVATAPLAGAQWSVLAVDLADGDTLLSYEPARRMIPGSTMKLLATVAALDALGPEYRWDTALWAIGPVDAAQPAESVAAADPGAAPAPRSGDGFALAGDLVLTTSGDPMLSTPGGDSATAGLERLAEALVGRGIRYVAGSLVVDVSTWDSVSVRPSWMVEDLPVPAGASGGALALAQGETHVEVHGGAAPGDPVTVHWWPLGEDGFVRTRLTTTGDSAIDVTATWLPESRALELVGTVPVGAVDTLALATRDPVRQSAAALYRALTARGITVAGGWRVAWDGGEALAGGCATGSVPDCPAARRVSALVSPPLMDVVDATLGPSQNWIAEQIVKTVGFAATGRAGWTEGLAAVRDHVEGSLAVAPADVRVVDGSGLSVQNLVTARALVAALVHAHTRPWGEAFRGALAEPGEEESTLEARLSGLDGRVYAKTGTLTNVGSLAGYLIDRSGREIAFAILVNGSNLPGATVRDAIDRIVRALSTLE